MTPALETAYHLALKQALEKGYALLASGGTAEEAVLQAVMSLEDNLLFNAGRGAVFTKKGEHEMDAAIMRGHDLAAGAVAGVQNIVNPIALAAEIMNHSSHVFLSGHGALQFALERKLPVAPDSYFYSALRFEQWQQVRDVDGYALDHNIHTQSATVKSNKMGTVGAVACDALGNVAAATSTGGMTNKQYNRIGDTPVIGSGTYASNATCAISCTGHGELFIRAVAAYDVSCLMAYKGLSLQQAMHLVVMEKLVAIGGEGGMIGVDAQGNAALLFNSEGMYRGVKNSEGLMETAIYQ